MKTKSLFSVVFIFVVISAYSQWSTDLRLTVNSNLSITSVNHSWCIAANGDTLHVVWRDNRDGNDEIYYKRSTDKGLTWGSDIRLTSNSSTSEYPSVTVSGSTVNVIWDDGRDGNFEIYSKRSTDGGATWGTDTRLTTNTAQSYGPCVTGEGLNLGIVWRDDRDGNIEVYYKRSTNGGISWGSDTRLTFDPSISWLPSISISGANVHVAWWDSRDGNEEIYYKSSGDGGITWGSDNRLTTDAASSTYASISSSGLFVHVVWKEYRDGDLEIYYKRSINGGISWGPDIRLSTSIGISELPSIKASGSIVHLVWDDDRNGNSEIYYKRSADGGVTWGLDTRLTTDGSISYCSSLSVSGSVVHIVWTDTRDSNYEVYYKRDPTGNVLEVSELGYNNNFVTIAPNPATGNFNVSLNSDLFTSQNKPAIEIFNILGEKIYSEELVTKTKIIDCSSFTGGIYFVKITLGENIFTKKLIVQ